MDVWLPCGDEKVEPDIGVPQDPSSPGSCFWRSPGGGTARVAQALAAWQQRTGEGASHISLMAWGWERDPCWETGEYISSVGV